MRKIDDNDLYELKKIFEYSSAKNLHEKIEYYSGIKARELGFIAHNGAADMERYEKYLLNDEKE